MDEPEELESPEKVDAEDAVEKDRSSGGHANSAGRGDADGDGEESRVREVVDGTVGSMISYVRVRCSLGRYSRRCEARSLSKTTSSNCSSRTREHVVNEGSASKLKSR